MPEITRTRVMMRTRYGWTQKTVPWSKTEFHKSGYLCNASGYVSMCWDIPLNTPGSYGGLSTLAMDFYGWAYEISPLDLKPGDALGLLGPGSVGTDGGSVVIFENWHDDSPNSGYAIVWKQFPDASPGPVRWALPYNRNIWHSYRFRDIVD